MEDKEEETQPGQTGCAGAKSGLTKAEIDAAMKVVVDNNVFATSGGDIVEAVGGRLRTTTLDPIAE